MNQYAVTKVLRTRSVTTGEVRYETNDLEGTPCRAPEPSSDSSPPWDLVGRQKKDPLRASADTEDDGRAENEEEDHENDETDQKDVEVEEDAEEVKNRQQTTRGQDAK